MTEKKYRVNKEVKFDYSEIEQYIGENYTDKPLRNDEIVDLLNEQEEEIKDLKCRLNSIYAILREEKCGDM